MKIQSLFIGFAILLSTYASSQNLAELPKVLPPPPDAAGLGRFGNYTVGLFKGEANIGIPIYEYTVGNISVPISLSYNSSGHRVDDIASNVGLGWTLSAGGVITRTVKGMPDFVKNRRVPDIRTFEPNMITADWRLMDTIVDQKLDTEPDIYSFSFLNRSGRYVFTDDSVAICLPFQKLKIDRTPLIVDEQGVKYFFEKGEVGETRDECSIGNPNDRDYTGVYPSSWYLSKVVNPNGDTMYFDYEDYSYQYKTGRTQVQYFFTPSGSCASFSDMNRDCINIRTVHAKRIRYIRSNRSDMFVEFIYSTTQREDIYSIDAYYTYESNFLERIVVWDSVQLLKSVRLDYDYFRSSDYNPSETTEHKGLRSRLKLTEIQDSASAPYKIEYIESVNLPARLSFSQDHYGYYNGKSNSTLIPSNAVVAYTGADRSSDSSYMKSNIIKQINHPTGGFTKFYFETNTGTGYKDSVMINYEGKTVNCNTGCHYKIDSITLSGEEGVYLSDFLLSYNLPSGDHCQGAIYGPGGFFMPLVGTVSNDDIDPLAPGVYYIEIEKPSYVNNVFITLQWQEKRDTSFLATIVSGGLRVRQIIDSTNSAPLETKTYKYNVPGTANTSSLIDYRAFNYLGDYRKKPTNPDYNYCTGFPMCFSKVLSSSAESSSYIDYSSFYGYQYVTMVYGTDSNNIGKSVNKFSLTVDDFSFDDNSDKSDMLIDWTKGHLLEVIDYEFNSSSQTYTAIKKTYSKYKAYFDEADYWNRPDTNYYTGKNEKFVSGFSYKRNQFGGVILQVGDYCPCEPAYDPSNCTGTYTHQYEYHEFEIEPYFISSIWYHKYQDSVLIYSQGSNEFLTEVINYYYDSSSHIQLTRTEQLNSKGELLKAVLKYPHNYTGQAVYDTMISRNMINNIVEKNDYLETDPTAKQKLFYGLSSNLVVKDSVQTAMGTASLKTEIKFDQYDSFGNLLKLTSVTKPVSSFIWDYNSTLPIAEGINASVSDIAYSSFEADGKGGWTYGGAVSTDFTSPTGKKCYDASGGSITKSGLTSAAYIVSYWGKNGSVTVNTYGPARSGKVIGDWQYYEHEVTATSITVSGSKFIDELRLYPKGAQMVTYTYTPLTGMTSQSDATGRIVYYEYDAFGRLMLIRDEDKRVVKKICYNYAGQPESCGIYYNVQKSDNFTRNNCGSGYDGSSVPYIVPAGTYISYVSQNEADSLAEADVDANGQAYANANGNCTPTANCHSGNCYAEGYKCINDTCEQGTKIYTSSVYNPITFMYDCTYHYEFSDSSWSQNYVEESFGECPVW